MSRRNRALAVAFLLTPLAPAMAAQAAAPQPNRPGNEIVQRNTLFNAYEIGCRGRLLSSARGIAAVYEAGLTVSALCECASAQEVASMSEENVSAALAGGAIAGESLNDMLTQQTSLCTQLLVKPIG